MQSYCVIVRTMFGLELEKVQKIPLADNTIGRRIQHMYKDIKQATTREYFLNVMFSLQLDESTDISGFSQLLVFIHYFIHDEKINDQFLCGQEMLMRTIGEDIFKILNSFRSSC